MSRRKPSMPRKLGLTGNDALTNIKQEPYDPTLEGSEVSSEATPSSQESCDTSPTTPSTCIKQEPCDSTLPVTPIKQEACDPTLQGSHVTSIKQEACDPIQQDSQVTLIKQEAHEPVQQGSQVTPIKQEACDPIQQGSQVTLIKQEACDPILQGSQVTPIKQKSCDPTPQSSQVTPVGQEPQPLQGDPATSQEATVASTNKPETTSSDIGPEFVWRAEKNTVIMTSTRKHTSNSTVLPTTQGCTVKEVSLGSLQVMEILPLEENLSSPETGDEIDTIRTNNGDKAQKSIAEMSDQQDFSTCEICQATFLSQQSLKRHMGIHEREMKKLKAESVDHLVDTRKEALSGYAETHPFRCDQCGEGFPSVTRLGVHRGVKQHFITNTSVDLPQNAGDYRCYVCGENFVHKRGLARHKATHKSQQWEEARSHQMMHLYKHKQPETTSKQNKQLTGTKCGDKPLMVGPSQFGQTGSAAMTDIKSKSKDDRDLHTCDVCKATFMTQHNLHCHMRIHMREMKKLKAENADQLADTRREAISGYAKMYPFQCDLCRERFQSKHGAEVHKRVRHYQHYKTTSLKKVPTVGIAPTDSLMRGSCNKRYRVISVEGGKMVVSSKGYKDMSGTVISQTLSGIKVPSRNIFKM